MSVSKNFPLQSVLDLSQLKLDESTRRLGELISGERQAGERLQLLVQYRDEYHERFLVAAKEGISRDQWQNYQAFLDRLDTAINQAKEMVAQSHQLTSAGQQDWLAKRGRVKAFDTLAQRHQARIVRDEARQQQKASDEHASRRHAADSQEES